MVMVRAVRRVVKERRKGMGQTCPKCKEWCEIVYNTGSMRPLCCPFCGDESSIDEWEWDDDDEEATP